MALSRGHTHGGTGGESPRGPAASLPRLKWVLALTTIFMFVEAAGGWISGSLALLADAGHMLTDVGALTLSLLTAWIAQRPPDDSKTYGYLRWEILAALVWRGALRDRRLGGGRGYPADPGPPAGADRPLPGRGKCRAAGQPGEPRGPSLRRGKAASTSGAPTCTCWATHWARSARSPRPGSSRSPAGRSPTRSSPSSCPSSSSWEAGGCSATAPTSCWSRCPATSRWRRSIAACSASPGVAAVHDLHVWTVTSGMIAMSGHAVVPDLEAHPGVLEGIRAEMSLLGIGHVTIQLEVEHGCEGCDDARDSATAPHWGHRAHAASPWTPPLRKRAPRLALSCGIPRRRLYMRRGGPGCGPQPFQPPVEIRESR